MIIVQARMGSKRLPGKVLMKFGNKTILEILLKRLKSPVTKIVVATPDTKDNLPIWELCNKLKVKYFLGSENDVLSRFYECAKFHKAKVIIRITADCPLNSWANIVKILSDFEDCDYLSNTVERSMPKGLDCEIFTFEALEKAHKEATDLYDREHVTSYIYRNKDKFKIKQYVINYSVDTQEDFERVRKIYESL